MAKQSPSAWKTWFIRGVLVLQAGAALSGAYTYYHFYWAPTGVHFEDTGKPASRARMIDMVLQVMVEANQTTLPNADIQEPAR